MSIDLTVKACQQCFFYKEEDAELTKSVIKTLLAHGLCAKGIVNQMRYVFRLLKIENEYS